MYLTSQIWTCYYFFKFPNKFQQFSNIVQKVGIEVVEIFSDFFANFVCAIHVPEGLAPRLLPTPPTQIADVRTRIT